jgi:hypothetical protein
MGRPLVWTNKKLLWLYKFAHGANFFWSVREFSFKIEFPTRTSLISIQKRVSSVRNARENPNIGPNYSKGTGTFRDWTSFALSALLGRQKNLRALSSRKLSQYGEHHLSLYLYAHRCKCVRLIIGRFAGNHAK